MCRLYLFYYFEVIIDRILVHTIQVNMQDSGGGEVYVTTVGRRFSIPCAGLAAMYAGAQDFESRKDRVNARGARTPCWHHDCWGYGWYGTATVCRNITINKLGVPRNQQASLMFQFKGQEFLHGFAIDPVVLNFVTLFTY